MSKYLSLWLEAPLQSWGYDSKFGRRDTLPFPTKSGIYGLYLAALGAGGAQRELLAELAEAKMTVYSFRTKKEDEYWNNKGKSPFLMDFQMVGSGYRDSKDHPWERLLIPKTAEGKTAVGGGSKMTYRYYLQDARFAVIQGLPTELATRIAGALQAPVYNLYFGRKNCVPSDFIYRGTFDSSVEAESFLLQLAEEKGLEEDFRVLDGAGEGDEMLINDIPVQFGEVKDYRDRKVTIVKNAG